jgi:hypothetical protein
MHLELYNYLRTDELNEETLLKLLAYVEASTKYGVLIVLKSIVREIKEKQLGIEDLEAILDN